MSKAKQVVRRFQMRTRVASRFAREFPSQEALNEYLKEHPNADRSNHSVRDPKKDEPKEDSKSQGGGSSSTPKSSGVFSEKEIAHLPETATQPTSDKAELYEKSKAAFKHQLDWLNQGKGIDKAIGATVVRKDQKEEVDYSKPGPVIVIGGLKGEERAQAKVNADYGGDWSRIGDIVRASIALDTMDDVHDTLDKLKASGMKLARKPKDRFAKPTEAGYRDLMLNVVHENGIVGELQLHLKSVLQAKDAGHKYYNEVRKIEDQAKLEGRTEMTPEERKTIDEANRKQAELYTAAFEKATAPKRDKTARMGTKVKYYDYNGLPAMWDDGKFPVVYTPKGKTRTIYELEKFSHEAMSISESEFKKLKADAK